MARVSKKTTAELSQKWVKWQTDPIQWVKDIFGDNIRKKSGVNTETGLTTQQETAMRELGNLCNAKFEAYKIAKGIRTEPLTSKEQEYADKIGISIMSGKGTGKDFITALIDRYFQMVWPEPRCMCVANNSDQLGNVLWSEISNIMDMSQPINPTQPVSTENPPILRHMFKWQKEKIFYKELNGERWFTEAASWSRQSTEKEQSATLGGRHSDYMCIMFDEASTIPDAVFRGIEGTLTGIINIVIVIFNPTRNVGFAVESHREDRKRWVCLQWNSEESEIYSKAQLAIMQEKFDRDDPPYRIDVLGLPPLAETDCLIPYDMIISAVDRDIEPLHNDSVIQSLDVGAGGDKSIMITRKGGKVYYIRTNSSRDPNEVTDWAYGNILADEADYVFVDNIGVGWAISGNLRKLKGSHVVRSVDSRNKAMREDKFTNKRAEMYWNLKEAFENKEIDIPHDDELIQELSVIKVKYDSGKVQIIKKADIKKDIGHSPDKADALAIGYAQKMGFSNETRKPVDRYYSNKYQPPVHEKAWMAA